MRKINIESSKKHAYLIMAHNNFDQLKILISLIDDIRNDIYLHIDKKSTGFLPETIKTEFSELFLVDPIAVTWGGYSQIQCEMLLFKTAASKHYMYYHVLSGLDLPIKTQDEIHSFFQKHSGKNFIDYDIAEEKTRTFLYRTQYFYFFQNITGRSRRPLLRLLHILDKASVKTQKLLRIKRKELMPLHKGANWVSITDEMVQYLLNCEKIIHKQFCFSFCADEVFLQSIAMQSPYQSTIINNSCRAIDWLRGDPYVYRKEDIPQLLVSPHLFARKFDSTADADAIKLIAENCILP